MIRHKSYVLVGSLFIAFCVATGGILFALSQPADGPKPAVISTVEALPSENLVGPDPTLAHASSEDLPAETPSAESDTSDSSEDEPSPTMLALQIRPDMDYNEVKKILVSGGFIPGSGFEGACSSIGEEECKPFPEIEACSGSGRGYCTAVFSREGQTLDVVTYGPGGPLASVEFREK